ncbi:hypothetical protein JOM56_006107 [Amanita muscaria]
MPPPSSHTLPVISSRSPPDPLPHSLSSPGPRRSEFERTLEQSFTWTPPDLTMSSQSGPSIVALSPSEVVQLGLGRFLDDPITSHLGDAQKSVNCAQASCSTSCSQFRERIQRLERLNHQMYANPSGTVASTLFRHSMDQAPSFDRLEHSQFHNVARVPLACSHLLSTGPASSISCSSASHTFPTRSSLNSGEASFRTGTSGLDYDYRPNRSSRGYASYSDNPSVIGATSHEPCSHSDIRNDDTPSALDFHINTFPSSMTGHNFHPYPPAVTRQENLEASLLRPDPLSLHVLSFCHTSDSLSTSLLQSLGTSDTLSLSPTFSDRVDLDRRLIHFPSPAFSLSQFPSTLSSPVFASSEVTESSGDGAALPSNCGATDIIINMTPISDDNDISTPGSPKSTRLGWQPERKNGVAEKVAKMGGKLKRLFLKKLRSGRVLGDKAIDDAQPRKDTEHHYEPNVNSDTIPVKPPGLPQHDKRKRVFSNLAQQLSLHVNDPPTSGITAVAVETDNSTSQDLLGTANLTEGQKDGEITVETQEPKPMKKRFSLSLFARSLVADEGAQSKKSRPKSMSDLLERHPKERAVGDDSMQSDSSVVPLPQAPINGSGKPTNKRSKRLSLQFLRERF